MFQSLVGFKINWNARVFRIFTPDGFQSLVGFKINWNSIDHAVNFQSNSFNP